MNNQLKSYLDSAPDLYPHRLEERFPRIVNKIVETWDSPEQAAAYFDDLLIDRRGGRQGFPPDVAREIFQLSVAYDKLRGKTEAAGDVWTSEREKAAAEIESLGPRRTPADMLQAAQSRDPQKLALFLEAGMPVDTRDVREWTPLMVASFHSNEAVAKLLVENGADPHASDRDGYSPLHWAALQGYQEVVALLAKHVDCNLQSNSGLTPLLQAAAAGHAEVVQLLLAAGADPNLASKEGWTPLHKAVANGHVGCVSFLVTAGASIRAAHSDGTTPLGLAVKRKRDDIVQLLRGAERGAVH